MLLLTLRGTPTVYYGDEIAMKEAAIAPAHVRDPLGKNVPGRGLGRDGCRTPMQWDSTTNAGFSSVEPWLPLGGALDQDNVLAQRSDNTSVYRLYRRLIDSSGFYARTRTRAALRCAQFCQRTGRRKFASRRVDWAAARIIRRRSCGRAGARRPQSACARGRDCGALRWHGVALIPSKSAPQCRDCGSGQLTGRIYYSRL
jgi:hypothetical protein